MARPPERHDRSSALARAKNTSRAEARRRTREEVRAELAAEQEPEDGAESTDGDQPQKTGFQPRRSGVLFKWPNIPDDIRSIPAQFRTKRLMWLPFVLIVVGFLLTLVYFGMPVDLQQYVALYLQFFFTPAALFTYFIAGFLATRASYIVGGMAGFLIGVLTVIAYLSLGAATVDPQTGAPLLSGSDLAVQSLLLVAETTFIGGVAGGFAGWYRDFLRRMQENSRARQTQREQEAKQKRAAERQEARRAAKQRSTS
jgi:hypothetical protein